jgi:hypothetical protein
MSATSTLAALLDSYEWRPAAEIEQKMSVAGYNHNAVRRARQHLGVSRDLGSVQRKDERWSWRLPDDLCPTCDRPWHAWALEGRGQPTARACALFARQRVAR